MKTISAWEMKAQWAQVERQVRDGETFEMLTRGRPSGHIVPARSCPVLVWDDHLATAIPPPAAHLGCPKGRDGLCRSAAAYWGDVTSAQAD